MKSKLKIFLLLSVAFYFGIEILNPFKEEVVDLKKFTDYYEENKDVYKRQMGYCLIVLICSGFVISAGFLLF